MCAVTSALGGSMTAPKSQNGSLLTSSRVLSASNAPQPPSLHCMPSSQRRPRRIAARLPRLPLAEVDPAQREDDLGGVVGVGVVVVLELERPAARRGVRAADLPVARLADLLVEHPVRGAARAPGGPRPSPASSRRDHRQHGVPDRGLARLEAAHAVLADREALEAVERLLDDRVVQAVAHQVQRHDRVHPRRLDAAPAAVGLLAGDDPVGAAAQRGPPGAGSGSSARSCAAPCRGR